MALLTAALETWYLPLCTLADNSAIRELRSAESALIAEEELETEMLSLVWDASAARAPLRPALPPAGAACAASEVLETDESN
jgi:hypothetical protein